MNSLHLQTVVNRLKKIAGLDFHIILTLVFRSWGIAAGGLTTLLLPLWLAPTQQGYYYTFGSLLALQVFFELGLNQVIIQLVSHEAAHLKFHGDGTISGDLSRIRKLHSICRVVERWYMTAAILFALIAGCAGLLFFVRKGAIPGPNWQLTWGLLVLFTSVNLFLSPRLAIIEGTGQVGQVARLRLIQSVIGYSGLWIVLFSGGGLWVTTVVPGVAAASTIIWLYSRGGILGRSCDRQAGEDQVIQWRRDIFPLQWRIALSWASGYFIFNMFTPIIFSHHGAKEAGRFGMAMAIFNSVSSLGLSWINAKTPSFAMHISRGESRALKSLFYAVTMRSTVFTGAVAFSVVAAVTIAAHAGWPGVHRIVDSWSLLWLAIATTVNVLVYAGASYMRAHREEPMVPVSVVSALCTVLAVVVSSDAPVSSMMAFYAAIGTVVTLPWTLILLRGYHSRDAEAKVSTLSP